MSKITVEQKLTMLNQLRSQYHKNQSDLMRREQILYGRTSVTSVGETGERWAGTDPESDTDSPLKSTFRIRLVIAVILTAIMILYDQNDKKILGVSTEQIYTVIADDYMAEFTENTEKIE